MKRIEVIQFLKRIKVQTGSLVCLGCGHEHNCSIHGCAIIRAAIEELEKVSAVDVRPVVQGKWIPEHHKDKVSSTQFHEYDGHYCSVCGRRLIGYSNPKEVPFCHCGADMRGDRR